MSGRSITVALAIIAKNERKSSEVIFPQINQSSLHEIFVTDGRSTDGTANYYRKQGIKVYSQREKGLGAATLQARSKTKCDAIVIFHPDGDEDPNDIQKIVKYLKRGYEMVIPSRMIKGGVNEEDHQLLKPRKWFNLGFAFVINMIWSDYRPFLSEVVQGFRGIRCDAFDKLKLDTKDRTIDCQMVIRALKYKLRIYEFPTIEHARLFGETKFKSLPTGYLNLKTFFREIIDPSTYRKD